MSGIGGWSPGNQSAGAKPLAICDCGKLSVLPGTCFIVMSGAAGVAGAAGAGAAAPGAGAPAGIAYAHAGGPPAARSAPVAKRVAAASTTRQLNLRINVSFILTNSQSYTPAPYRRIDPTRFAARRVSRPSGAPADPPIA